MKHGQRSNKTERKLKTFENKTKKRICGTTYDVELDSWELYEMVGVAPVTSWIIGQKLQWLGRIMRKGKNNNTVKSIIE